MRNLGLIKLIKSSKTNKFFSAQTQKQIEIGLGLSKDIEADIREGNPPEKALLDVISQQIDPDKRSDEWKDFYADEMNEIMDPPKRNSVLPNLILEHKAFLSYKNRDIENTVKHLQAVIDNGHLSDEEKVWYLQEIARYYSSFSVERANYFQNIAYKLNYNLFKPRLRIRKNTIDFQVVPNA